MKYRLCRFAYAITISILLSMAIGCHSDKIQVIHNDHVVTNAATSGTFNDETYVWEKWSFSTNKVNAIK